MLSNKCERSVLGCDRKNRRIDAPDECLFAVTKHFLALGEPVDAPAEEEPQMKAPSAVPKTPGTGANGDANIFGMGRG